MLCLHAYMPPHASMLPQSLARAEPCGDSQSLGIRCRRPAGREAREKVSRATSGRHVAREIDFWACEACGCGCGRECERRSVSPPPILLHSQC